MKLVRLDDTTSINPLEIVEVSTSTVSGVITVRVRSGIGYKVFADYGKSVSSTYNRLVAEINAAMEGATHG